MTPKEKRLLILLINGKELMFGPLSLPSLFWNDNKSKDMDVYYLRENKDSWWFEGHHYFSKNTVLPLIQSGYVVDEDGKLCITEQGVELLKRSKKGGLKVHRDHGERKDRNVKGRKTLGNW